MTPFRAEQVGSLLRPPDLLQARTDFHEKRITREQLRAIEDEAIRDSVRMQENIGLPVITDGEFRRESFLIDFYREISGLTDESVQQSWQAGQGAVAYKMTGFSSHAPLRLDHTIFGDDFSFLRDVTKAAAKITIPAPSILHRRWGRTVVNAQVYPKVSDFWRDLAGVYADEIERLAGLGCRYVQLDDTSFATLCDPKHREAVADLTDDPDGLINKYIELINESVRHRPPGVRVGVHTCRGNHRSSWFASGGYDFVAEALFSELDTDIFLLEYDDERSGGFEPLRFVPKGKTIVLGLVSSKHPKLETQDYLRRRIDEAAKFLPLDQLALSPQCGFASTVEGNLVSIEDQYAKLRLVVETAREVWG